MIYNYKTINIEDLLLEEPGQRSQYLQAMRPHEKAKRQLATRISELIGLLEEEAETILDHLVTIEEKDVSSYSTT